MKWVISELLQTLMMLVRSVLFTIENLLIIVVTELVVSRTKNNSAEFSVLINYKTISQNCFRCHVLSWSSFLPFYMIKIYFVYFHAVSDWDVKFSILQQVTQIDNDLKAKASAYNNLKGNLQSLERRAT